jgi:hypothetical protein
MSVLKSFQTRLQAAYAEKFAPKCRCVCRSMMCTPCSSWAFSEGKLLIPSLINRHMRARLSESAHLQTCQAAGHINATAVAICSGDPDGVAAVKQRMPFKKSKPLLLGKLRVRLSTVAPGRTWTVALPMLAGRRNGGEHTATAHMSMRVGCMFDDSQQWIRVQGGLTRAATLTSWPNCRCCGPTDVSRDLQWQQLHLFDCRSTTAVARPSWHRIPGRH